MPYHLYLHRSFDIQLSPVAASIIDWASSRRGSGMGAEVSPGVSPANYKKAPQSVGRHTCRSEMEQGGESRWRSCLPSSGSHCSIDSFIVRPLETLHKDGPLTPTMCGDHPTKEAFPNQDSTLRVGQRQILLNSYAAIPLIKCGSFSLNAGLFAALGMTSGVPPPTLALPSSSSLSGRHFFHASDVLQVECIWGRMQWTGALNIVCFPWRSKALPLCELIGITPMTDWSVQADRLLFNWSGFCRVFVRGRKNRSDSFISGDSSAKPYLFGVDADFLEYSGCSNSCTTSKSFPSSAGEGERGPFSASDINGGVELAQWDHQAAKIQSGGKESVAGASRGDLSSGDDTQLHELAGLPEDVEFKRHMGRDVQMPPTKREDVRKWWRLEELRCGVGFAVKNDLASGVNVYCGCSGHFGRALTVSTHVDALRRACCSVTCTSPSLDLAARLRMNFITWHRTELDAGVGWRPFKKKPGLTCRLSHSMGRNFIGVTIKDISVQCSSLLHRDGRKGCDDPAPIATARQRRGLSEDKAISRSIKEPVAASASTVVESLSLWYDPYTGWLKHVAGLFLSTASKPDSVCADPTRAEMISAPGLLERLSQAVRVGADYAVKLPCQTEFDLSMGVAAERPHGSRSLRPFIILSAH